MKKFLKPTVVKIILVIIIGIILTYSSCHRYSIPTPGPEGIITAPTLIIECGFPSKYLKAETSALCTFCLSNFQLDKKLNLVINLLFWYLLSCLIVFILKKGIKKLRWAKWQKIVIAIAFIMLFTVLVSHSISCTLRSYEGRCGLECLIKIMILVLVPVSIIFLCFIIVNLGGSWLLENLIKKSKKDKKEK